MINETPLECPFCGELTLSYIPTYHNVDSSGWGRSSKIRTTRGEDILLMSECSKCGKSEKEIRKKFKELGMSYG